MNKTKYAGFWIRAGASLIDTILMLIFVTPVITAIYGTGFWDGTIPAMQGFWWSIVNYVLPAIVVVLFWVFKSATPGKLSLALS